MSASQLSTEYPSYKDFLRGPLYQGQGVALSCISINKTLRIGDSYIQPELQRGRVYFLVRFQKRTVGIHIPENLSGPIVDPILEWSLKQHFFNSLMYSNAILKPELFSDATVE